MPESFIISLLPRSVDSTPLVTGPRETKPYPQRLRDTIAEIRFLLEEIIEGMLGSTEEICDRTVSGSEILYSTTQPERLGLALRVAGEAAVRSIEHVSSPFSRLIDIFDQLENRIEGVSPRVPMPKYEETRLSTYDQLRRAIALAIISDSALPGSQPYGYGREEKFYLSLMREDLSKGETVEFTIHDCYRSLELLLSENPNLTDLSINWGGGYPQKLQAVLGFPSVDQLRALSIGNCYSTPNTVRIIADAPNLSELRSLYVSMDGAFGTDGIYELLHGFYRENLERLGFSLKMGCQEERPLVALTAHDIASLCSAFPKLNALDIFGVQITEEDFAHIPEQLTQVCIWSGEFRAQRFRRGEEPFPPKVSTL